MRPRSHLKWVENTKKVMRGEDLNDKRNVNNTYGIVEHYRTVKTQELDNNC